MTTDDPLLSALLDAIVPPCPERGLPGAGELGLAAAVGERLGGMRGAVDAGLAALDARARDAHGRGFAELAPAARGEILSEHVAAEPAFLGGLVFLTYSAYYQQPRVLEALGLEPRPPYPAGHRIDPSDWDALLAPVRARPRLYREA